MQVIDWWAHVIYVHLVWPKCEYIFSRFSFLADLFLWISVLKYIAQIILVLVQISTESTRQVIALIRCLCVKESCLNILLNYYFCDSKKKKKGLERHEYVDRFFILFEKNCTLNNIIAQPQKQICTCMMGYSSIRHQAKKYLYNKVETIWIIKLENNTVYHHHTVAAHIGIKTKALNYVFLRLKRSFHWVDLHGNATSAIFLNGYLGLHWFRLQAARFLTKGKHSKQFPSAAIRRVHANTLLPKQTDRLGV